MNEENIIRGKIVATQLGTFGPKEKLYGYATVRKDDGEPIKVKIDSRTECDSLTVGDTVEVHTEDLGITGIIIARRVVLIPGPFFASTDESTAEAAV